MANYQESQPLQFSQYRGINPETYSAVGMYKQQQYDMGVQKINGVLENIAGLDVMRDVDKEYLNGKVNSLTNQINNLAGADWSNKNLIYQVQGLSSQIARDKNVQSAVMSTMRIKSLQKSQQDILEKSPDKYSPSNQWYDNKSVESYLANGQVGSVYSGPTQATQFFDYQKLISDRLKELDPTITTKIDQYGQFQYQISKDSKVTADQVSNVINGTINSDPRIQKQIGIDGMYSYKDHDAITLSQTIDKNYSSTISQYDKLIEEEKKNKTLNPLDVTANAQSDANIAAYENAKKQQESLRGRYAAMFQSGASLDAIKQTVFNDQLRNTLIATYQQDKHETELHINENAVKQTELLLKQEDLFLDYIKAGIDPETKQAIKPGSKYYSALKSSRTTGANPEGMTVALPTGEGTTSTEYSEATHNAKITTLKEQKTSQLQKLRNQYIAQTGASPGADTEANFTKWQAIQENKIANGEQADINYLKYKASIRNVNLEMQSLVDAKTKIETEAVTAHPYKGTQPVIINGINFNGRSFNTTLDPNNKDNAILMDRISGIWSEIEAETARLQKEKVAKNPRLSNIGNPGVAEKSSATNTILEKYRNDPNYGFYEQMFKNPKIKSQIEDKIIYPQQQAIIAQDNYKKNAFKELGNVVNEQMTTVSDKPEVQQEYKNFVLQNMLSSNDDKLKDAATQKNANISLVGAYIGEDGREILRVKVKDEFYDVPSSSNSPQIASINPNRSLDRIIRLSPTKMTPTSGPNVLTSTNGKLRYVIGLNQLDDTSYDLYILDGPNKIPVYNRIQGQVVPIMSPSEAEHAIEQASMDKDPKTGQPLSPQQLLEKAKAAATAQY